MAATGRPAHRTGNRAGRPGARAGSGSSRGLSLTRRLRPGLSILAAVAGFLLAATVPVSAQTDEGHLKHGENLLITYCGSCHATGRTGNSRRAGAPPFRTLGKRYPIDSLEESLGEGIMAGHPDMPELSFEGDDVGAIVDYLKSIQVR